MLTRAVDMAMMVIAVLDKHCNGNEFRSEDTVYGSLKIDTMLSNYCNELDAYLNDELNRKDPDAHIDILYRALKRYKERN